MVASGRPSHDRADESQGSKETVGVTHIGKANASAQSPHQLTSEATRQLVTASIAGDRSAMQRLYEQCSPQVYGLMLRMVGPQDADDLTQHVFLQMFRKLEQYHGRSKLETWLYRLASNEALQHLRRRKRHATISLDWEPESTEDRENTSHEMSRLLEAALARLDSELRLVFLLKEAQGLSYREIAEAVGIPEGTVGSRLNRARKELRDGLRKLADE